MATWEEREDRVTSQVREEHLLPISYSIVVWEKVALYLGLSEVDVESIREDIPHYELRKHRVLKIWRDRNGQEATYQCLISRAKENFDTKLALGIERDILGKN